MNQLKRHWPLLDVILLPFVDFTTSLQPGMIGARALRTCSVCRDRLRATSLRAAPAFARSVASTSAGRYDVESSRVGLDDSVLHPIGTTTRISDLESSLASTRGDSLLGSEEEEEWTPRKERRSPAAVFGSKRLGLETIPRRMEENIQSEIDSKLNSSDLSCPG